MSMQCSHCEAFFARFRCNSPLECDCPRCQGYCECQTTGDPAEMYQQMVDSDSDEMDFVVTREDRMPGRTISRDALRELNAVVNLFITSRITHHWEKKPLGMKDVGPSVIKAEVRITVDDVHHQPAPNERPWYVIDGGKRLLDA